LISSNIRTQAILLSVVPLAFLLLLLALALMLQNSTEEAAAWSQRSAEILSQSERASNALGVANRGVVDYVARHQRSALDAYRGAAQALPGELKKLRLIVRDEPAQEVRATHLSHITLEALSVVSGYLADIQSGHAAAAKRLASSARTRSLGLQLQAAVAEFDAAQRKLEIGRIDAVRRELQSFGIALLVCCIAGIVLTLLTAARFGLRIVRRLERLAENARRLGAGEATEPISGNDEIAALDRVYHDMTRRMHHEHDVASTLQRALLPQELPKISGLRIDTAYVPAARGTEIGGDWYDVFTLSGRCVGIGVGDVAGHGLRAATIMGSVRQAIRMMARTDAEPAEVLRRVNRELCEDERDVVVTAFFGVLDLQNGAFRYALAGHPAPLTVGAGGNVAMLSGAGLMLGVDPRAAFTNYETQLELGSGLVLYTDGIVEVERDYFKGLSDLQSAVKAEYLGGSDNVAEAIQRRIFARAKPHDDSAILFVGITNLSPSASVRHRKTWSLNAREEAGARRVKRALLWHLGEFASLQSDLTAVELIFGELLGNVARHTSGLADITVECADGAAVLHVADRGEPFALNGHVRPDLFSEGGRGLFLISAIARSVSVERVGEGNRVTVVLPVSVE
jgi:serine phosphatase RsbU (regulator of sigma subunit)/anti-sigma regulatory factor (Ser/Thr protein kinase)